MPMEPHPLCNDSCFHLLVFGFLLGVAHKNVRTHQLLQASCHMWYSFTSRVVYVQCTITSLVTEYTGGFKDINWRNEWLLNHAKHLSTSGIISANVHYLQICTCKTYVYYM